MLEAGLIVSRFLHYTAVGSSERPSSRSMPSPIASTRSGRDRTIGCIELCLGLSLLRS
jgi:hypothetical protein